MKTNKQAALLTAVRDEMMFLAYDINEACEDCKTTKACSNCVDLFLSKEDIEGMMNDEEMLDHIYETACDSIDCDTSDDEFMRLEEKIPSYITTVFDEMFNLMTARTFLNTYVDMK